MGVNEWMQGVGWGSGCSPPFWGVPETFIKRRGTSQMGHVLTHSRRDLLNVMDFEYLQLGGSLGIMSVKEFWKKTN